jgi:hypothetical protein
MKIFGNIVGVVVTLLGALWTLQGADVLGGSVMSGQSQWLYIGIAMLIAGLTILYWVNLRPRPPRL